MNSNQSGVARRSLLIVFAGIIAVAGAFYFLRISKRTVLQPPGLEPPSPDIAEPYLRSQMPELLSYAELVQLGNQGPLPLPLADKMNRLLTTPFVNNQAFYAGATAHRPDINGLGPSLRVVFWNIERGFRVDDIIDLMTDKKRFLGRIDRQEIPVGDHDEDIVKGQIDILQAADVVILNEVDWGMKRTGYLTTTQSAPISLSTSRGWMSETLEVRG